MDHSQLKSAVITVGEDGRGFVVQGKLTRYVITAAGCLPCSSVSDAYEPDWRVKLQGVERFANRALELIREAPRALAAIGKPPLRQYWPPFSWRSASNPCRELLGTLVHKHLKPLVSAQCLFLDPIANLAILGSPWGSEYDGNELEAEYEALTTSVSPLRISDAAEWSRQADDADDDNQDKETPVWVLSPTGGLIACTAVYSDEFVGASALHSAMGIEGGETVRTDGIPPSDPFSTDLYGMLGSPIIVAEGSAIGIQTGFRQGARLTQHLPGWFLREIAQAAGK